MEPILPEPTPLESIPPNSESAPKVPVAGAGGVETRPNTAPERSHERQKTAQSSPAPKQSSVPASKISPGLPTSTTPVAAKTPASDDPLIADDVDVIEKEWVDKAKKIVNATKEDPFQQEKEVSKLQADYLLKRYNKQVKLSE